MGRTCFKSKIGHGVLNETERSGCAIALLVLWACWQNTLLTVGSETLHVELSANNNNVIKCFRMDKAKDAYKYFSWYHFQVDFNGVNN